MARFLLFLLLLVPLVVAGDWLLANPGEVTIHWFGYDITLHVAVVALLLLIVAILMAVMTSLLWQLTTWPERRRARRKYRTLARGLTQLTHGVTALALGDEAAAHASLNKALAALPGEPLPQLLSAQLLQRQGRHDEARNHLRALMRHEITAPLATRRLIEQHVARQEFLAAIQLAEQARTDATKDRWLVLTLLDLYARTAKLSSMLALTEGWHWQSPLARDERHHYAALAYFLSAESEPDAHKKAQALRHATGYASEFLPATLACAQLLLAEGNVGKARKWLRAAWNENANLLLIAPILDALKPETPRAQLRYLKPFVGGEASLVKLLLAARQALQAGEPERAKPLATQALAIEECREACTLMADIEKELNGSIGANPWLARAMSVPVAASWLCADCGTLHDRWQSHCRHCSHFDRIHYERPEARITSVELAPV